MHTTILEFLGQVIAIVVASRALSIPLRKLGQPLVIAEIGAGILLGPSLLGRVAPNLSAALFAEHGVHTLHLTSQIGLIFFMFLVGLELDLTQLRGRGRTAIVISHMSIVVPFGLGALLAIYLHAGWAGANSQPISFALFLGIAMSITAFPVLARILSDRGLIGTHVGTIAMACAAIDDVTAWCLLAFVVAIARSKGLGSAALTTGLALGYIAFMLAVVRPCLKRVFGGARACAEISHDRLALIVVLLLLSSVATESIGIHAIFGAFVAGAIMPKEHEFEAALTARLKDFVVVVLLPLFFAYSGVRTQIGLLNTWNAWLVCALIIVVACLGKFGGTALAARVTGMSWRDAGVLGVLTNTRGLMELIVLNIGLDLGVITPQLFTAMVLMALVTTMMTTPILQLLSARNPQSHASLEVRRGPSSVPETTIATDHAR